MAKHQHYDYSQSVIAPIFLEDQLLPGTLEYAIHYIVEERLNMSIFDARYNNDNTGRKSIDPKLLMKIVIYGYSRGMISSNEPRIGSTGKQIQSNVTDNESAKMATSHGVQQGYNANAMVDDKNQIVTCAQVFGSGTDTKAMAPMLEKTRKNLEAVGIEKPLEGKKDGSIYPEGKDQGQYTMTAVLHGA